MIAYKQPGEQNHCEKQVHGASPHRGSMLRKALGVKSNSEQTCAEKSLKVSP
jgi:hypothetical protein